MCSCKRTSTSSRMTGCSHKGATCALDWKKAKMQALLQTVRMKEQWQCFEGSGGLFRGIKGHAQGGCSKETLE